MSVKKFMSEWLAVPALSAVFMLLIAFTCAIAAQDHTEPRTLVDTPTLLIENTGRHTTVKDRAGGDEYQFTRNVIKRSQAPMEIRRAVETENVTIDLLPGGGLRIHDLSAGKCYIVRPKRS